MIRDLPIQERPREKMMHLGVRALSNAELLALLIRTGNRDKSALALAQDVLELMQEGIHELGSLTTQELCSVKGIGPSKAALLLAASELARRISMDPCLVRERILTPDEVYHRLGQDLKHLAKEVFRVAFLDTKHAVIDCEDISVGSLNASIVHPREVFNRAVKKSAAALILMHNHPSGHPEPSAEDIALTRRLVKAGEMMGINILDHVIIGRGGYLSMKAQNLI